MNDLETIENGKDLILLVENMVDCYRECTVTSEIEETKREKVRNQARVMIAQIEANTEQYVAQINKDTATNIALIQTIGKLLEKPQLDEDCYKICEMILGNLR